MRDGDFKMFGNDLVVMANGKEGQSMRKVLFIFCLMTMCRFALKVFQLSFWTGPAKYDTWLHNTDINHYRLNEYREK